MGTYNYKARDKFGKLVTGVMESDSEDSVALALKAKEYVPVSIGKTKPAAGGIFKLKKKISAEQLNMFTRQFFVLQKAGLSIISIFHTLGEQSPSKTFKDVLRNIAKNIQEGSTLSQALKQHPDIFNNIYISMIEVGEASGMLSGVLERLAVLQEAEEELNQKIKTATRYPLIVVIAVVIAFLVLTAFVVPRFAQIFASSGAELPLPTRILIGLNYTLINFWWLCILGIGGIIFCFNKIIATPKGRQALDSIKLKIPVFGPLLLMLSMSRFSRVTATLMASGVSLLKILVLASAASGNSIVSRAIDAIEALVKEGEPLSRAMLETKLFPPAVVQMVIAGETSGELEELLLHVSNYYDQQTKYIISNLTSLIEPLLIFVLGLGVLFLAMGIFLPMWNMMSIFTRG